MTKAGRIRGFVQAGGGSTRFGSDKALSVLGGRTMLARTSELVSAVCGNVKIIAAGAKYPNAPAEIVADRWPGEGPLGGILSALMENPSEPADEADHWSLIVGCDMPFLTAEWLSFLCQRAMVSEELVVVARSPDRLEPLCACWSSLAAPALLAAFISGERKVTQAMKRVPMEVLDESAWKRFDNQGRLFWNMNTADQFEEARRIIEADAP